MSKLELACNTQNDRDYRQILIQEDNISIVENGVRGGRISIKDMTWDVDSAFQTSISLPVGGEASFDSGCFLSGVSESGLKFIAITSENSLVAEKKYENDHLWFKYGNHDPIPMGGLVVFTGTSLNRLGDVFTFFNGTPISGSVTGGEYDVTLNIIAGA